MRCAHENHDMKDEEQRYQFEGVEIDGKPVTMTFPLPTRVCGRCGLTLWRGPVTLLNMKPVLEVSKKVARSVPDDAE